MVELPLVIDNVIEENLQDQIEDAMFDCKWEYFFDVDQTKYKIDRRKFLSPFQYDVSPLITTNILSKINIEIYNVLLPSVKNIFDKINFDVDEISRFYGCIYPYMQNGKKPNCGAHVDNIIPHLVLVYYVNDCEGGETILYDKTIDDIPIDISCYPDEYCDLNVQHRIKHKKGRVLVFDGKFYHTGSVSKNVNRCFLNFNLFGKFKDGSYKFTNPKKKIFDYE